MIDDAEIRSERTRRMLGADGVDKLARSRIMVIGIGGVGSSCIEALARGGIGSIIVVDYDVVERSNINRQAIAFEKTLGRKKTDVMCEMIEQINPDAAVECICMRVLPNTVSELLDGRDLDYCIDAQDTITTKLALAKYCNEHGIRFLSSMGAANKTDPTSLTFADIYETSVCPMSRSVRKQARAAHIESMPVLYTAQAPVKVQSSPGAARSERSNLGTMSYMPPIMGQMLAARAICDLVGIEWQ